MTDLPLIFATVGTDVHPFDRMSDWIDAWIDGPAGATARCFVQTGTSKPPARAEHSPYLGYADMEAMVREAAVVVCHGGPGTIMLAASLGKIPIVVPRSASLGEHVDDHQMDFCARIEADGAILLARTEEELGTYIDVVLSGEMLPQRSVAQSNPAEAAERFEQLVEGLFQKPAESAQPVEVLTRGREA